MWRLLTSGLVLTLTLTARGPQNFRSRYGEPYVQRFRVDSRLRLTARYDRLGKVCAKEIRPNDLDPFAWPLVEDPPAADQGCTQETRSSLKHQYGLPEYERFAVQPGAMLAVTYRQDRSVKQIDIRKYSALLYDKAWRTEDTIEASVAQRLLDEILSPEVRKACDSGRHSSVGEGEWAQGTATCGPVEITRLTSRGHLLGYSITWR